MPTIDLCVHHTYFNAYTTREIVISIILTEGYRISAHGSALGQVAGGARNVYITRSLSEQFCRYHIFGNS